MTMDEALRDYPDIPGNIDLDCFLFFPPFFPAR